MWSRGEVWGYLGLVLIWKMETNNLAVCQASIGSYYTSTIDTERPFGTTKGLYLILQSSLWAESPRVFFFTDYPSGSKIEPWSLS